MEGYVTAIEPQPRTRGKRVNVFLNDRYALSLPLELAESLRIGQFVSSEQFDSLHGGDERARALDSALHFLGYRPRSESEIRTRLRSKGYADVIVDRVMARLAELKLVDDRSFAAYWLEQRQGRSPRGRRLIDGELRSKGVSPDTIASAAEDSADESELAYIAGQKRANALAALDEREFKQRLGAYLQRRGFDWESISSAIRRLRADLDSSLTTD
ncbi:MAG TPA: RecX family transcriptional regulator [Chloroflexota bacterium]|nr:RecX family transcriptional regulator [Chloroflexota bacterium]